MKAMLLKLLYWAPTEYILKMAICLNEVDSGLFLKWAKNTKADYKNLKI